MTHWSLPRPETPVGALPEPAFVQPVVGPQLAKETRSPEAAPAPADATPASTVARAAAAGRIGRPLAVQDLSARRYGSYDRSQPYRTPTDIKRLEFAFQLFNAVDAASTIACMQRDDCHEENPIYGRKPKTAVILGAKAVSAGVHYWVMRTLLPEHPGMARAFGWLTATIQGGVVGLNMSQLF